ncbi:MAG: hypothetical protein JWO32_2341 [Bacteroidetes bacterium]|nr:hypothetical protein [Bacteroidota bacterium]
MKKKLRFVFVLLVLHFGCILKTAAQNSISGELKNLPQGSVQLLLEEDINRQKSRPVAQVPIDSKGFFKIEKLLSPNIYSLRLPDGKSIMLAIDKGQKIVIKGDASNLEGVEVTGSEDTRKLMEYERVRKESLSRLVTSVRNQIRELKEKGAPENDFRLQELAKMEIDNYNQHRDELIEYIKREMGTSLAVYPTSIRWEGEKNLPFLKQLAKRFEKAHPHTMIAARVTEKVRILNANTIGQKVTGITMPDKEGKLVSLSSIQANYILIDFWASWCIPCRRESGLLGELYQQYKLAGFEIYGVGLESGKDNWLKAIERDKRTWINVSTFQMFETPVTFDYAVTSLPANVLIDKTGKILGKNLHGEELKIVIDKLFNQSSSN